MVFEANRFEKRGRFGHHVGHQPSEQIVVNRLHGVSLNGIWIIGFMPLHFTLASQHGGHQSRPASLVIGAQTASRVRMKVLVEQNQVAPVGVIPVEQIVAVRGTATVGGDLEQGDHATLQFSGDLQQRHHVPASGWAFDLEVVVIKGMVTLERLNQ